jgi:hypothetical protein
MQNPPLPPANSTCAGPVTLPLSCVVSFLLPCASPDFFLQLADPRNPVAAFMGAANLHPTDWFKPFKPDRINDHVL